MLFWGPPGSLALYRLKNLSPRPDCKLQETGLLLHLDLQTTLLLVLGGRYAGDVEAMCAVQSHQGHHQDRYRSGEGHVCVSQSVLLLAISH